LNTGDIQLRGTALEYLENVLPAPIRQGLWPYLVPSRAAHREQPHDKTIARLLQSSESMTIRNIARELGHGGIAGFRRV
jgi:hypothetical protein